MLIASQPVHVQDDPVDESRETSFTRRFVGTTGVKTIAVPADEPIHVMDLAYRNPLEERLLQEGRGDSEVL
jgi:hypothetical protein